MAIGIVAAGLMPCTDSIGVLGGAIVAETGLIAALVAVFMKKRQHTALFVALLMAAACGMGILSMWNSRNRPQVEWPESKQLYRSQILRIHKDNPRSWRVVCSIDGHRAQGVLVKSGSQPLPGDSIWLLTQITRPKNYGNPGEMNYSAYLQRDQIDGTFMCYAKEWAPMGKYTAKFPSATWFLRQRSKLVERYKDYFSDHTLAVVASLTLGDRSLITSDTRTLFSQSGTAHVIALSGFHLSIFIAIANLFMWLFVRSRRWRMWLGLCLIPIMWAFCMLAGAPSSLVRAVIMASLYQFLLALQHDLQPLNLLSLAAIAFFLVSPNSLYDVGFQLSFVAMIAIYAVYPQLPQPGWLHKSKALQFLYGTVMLSLAAQIGTFPIVAYHFHSIPLYGLLSTLLILPFAYLILGGGLAFFLIPPVQSVVAFIMEKATTLMLAILTTVSHWPLSHIAFAPTMWQVGLFYLSIGCLIAPFRQKGQKWLCLAILAGLIVLCGRIARGSLRLQPQIAIYNSYLPLVHIIGTEEETAIWASNDSLTEFQHRMARNHLEAHKDYRPSRQMPLPTRTATLYADSTLIVWGSKTIAIPHRQYGNDHEPIATRPTDILFVTKAFRGSLRNLCLRLQPKTIVIGADLSEQKQRKYAHEVADLPVRCHIVSKDGAYIEHFSD